MRSEKILNAIGQIDDELILQAVEPSENTNIRWSRWVKYAAVAACLCLLLAFPIIATQNEMLVDFFSDMTGWHVRSKEYYTDKDFSKEVRTLSKELAGEQTYLPMDSMEEAEAFLGIAMPDNSFLTEEDQDEVHIEVDEDSQRVRYDTPCLVFLAFGEDGAVIAADTNVAYRYGEKHLYVMYRVTTEYAASIGGDGMGGMEADITDAQTYTTASGRECAVVYTGSDDGIFAGYGYTVVDSVLVELSLVGKSEEEIRQTMIEVLDGFA